MSGFPLFEQPAKQMADTSIAVYRDVIVPTISARQQTVVDALTRYTNCTAYELYQWMKRVGWASDLNDVRPRLTELLKAKRVTRDSKRRCTVTGHTAYTWRVK